jgi:hypothetical protein
MAIQSNEQFNLTLKPITFVDPLPYNKNYIYLPNIYFFFLQGVRDFILRFKGVHD